MNWIPVDERRPNPLDNVVVWMESGVWLHAMWNGSVFVRERDHAALGPVTHWLEITPPQSPDEQRRERLEAVTK